MPALELLTEAFPEDAVRDMAVTHALLRQVAAGERGPALRLFRPGPTLAFGRLDARMEGFAAARERARDLGFTPVVRLAGGQAAAYDRRSLVVEEVSLASDPAIGLQERFAEHARLLAQALRALGLDARVGRLPGEYCPGDHSVNVAGRLKIAGIAQRVVKGAALVSAVVVVGSGPRIRRAITEVYGALGREVDPATAGGLGELTPHLAVGDVREAILGAYRRRAVLEEGELGAALLARAAELEPSHRA